MDTPTFPTDGTSETPPVLQTVLEAYGSPVRQWRTLVVIAAPLIVFSAVAHEIASPFGHSGLDSPSKVFAWFLVGALSIYFDIVLTMTWLRAVALHPPRPEILFDSFGRLWGLFTYGLLYAAVVWGPSLIAVMNLRSDSDEEATRAVDIWISHPRFMVGMFTAVFLTSTLFIARVGLVFPATALDRVMNLRAAWRKSSGIFWRFATIVVLVDLPFELASAGFDFLKIGAGDVTYTAISLLASVVDYIGFLILLAAVSLVYCWRHNLRSEIA